MAGSPAYSTVALTNAVIGYIERERVVRALKQSTKALVKIADVLSRDYDEVTQHVVDLGQRTAQQRICHLFCNLVEWSKAPVIDNACLVRLPLRQEDIAHYLGLTTAHVNRTLASMRRQKLITLEEDRLRINDLAALHAQIT